MIYETWSCGCRVIASNDAEDLVLRVRVCNKHVTIAHEVLTQVVSEHKVQHTHGGTDAGQLEFDGDDELPF